MKQVTKSTHTDTFYVSGIGELDRNSLCKGAWKISLLLMLSLFLVTGNIAAQSFITVNEMLKMIKMDDHSANQYMKSKKTYKVLQLGAYSTGYYKGCKAYDMSLATNPSQVWMELEDIKVGVSTGITINNEPGDIDVRSIEAIVYGKKYGQAWHTQLKQLGYALSKWEKPFNVWEEWTYKKENSPYAFHLNYNPHQNGYYCLTVWRMY